MTHHDDTTTATASTDRTNAETIDWNRFWIEADEADRRWATPSRVHVVDLLREFVDEKGVPGTFADVGCGTGHVAFSFAEGHSETEVIGYDAASPIVEERTRAIIQSDNSHFRPRAAIRSRWTTAQAANTLAASGNPSTSVGQTPSA
jgi:tRNA G46 methylase TrmB